MEFKAGPGIGRVRPLPSPACWGLQCIAAVRRRSFRTGTRSIRRCSRRSAPRATRSPSRCTSSSRTRSAAGSWTRSSSGPRAGVEVRLLFDWFGSIRLRKKYVARARGRPASWSSSSGRWPLRNLVRMYRRNHRRAIVIDGEVAFTGGAAIAKKWAGDARNEEEWRDSMTRVTGSLVTGIQAAFATNWAYCTGEVLAGPRFFPSPAIPGRDRSRFRRSAHRPTPCSRSGCSAG